MTNNLDLEQVAASQAQKEVSFNLATAQLDAAFTANLAVDLATDGSTVLTDSEFQRNIGYTLTHDTQAETLTLPTTSIPRFFFVDNSSGTDIADIIKGSTTVSIVAGGVMSFICDGTTDGLVSVSENLAFPFDLGTFFTGVPGNTEIIMRFIFTRAVDFQDNWLGSLFEATTTATAETIFPINKNGGKVGDITIAIAGTSGVFDTDTPGVTSFAIGDRIEITGPATADVTLADFDVTLFGTRG
jgi:hypothetical protein